MGRYHIKNVSNGKYKTDNYYNPWTSNAQFASSYTSKVDALVDRKFIKIELEVEEVRDIAIEKIR